MDSRGKVREDGAMKRLIMAGMVAGALIAGAATSDAAEFAHREAGRDRYYIPPRWSAKPDGRLYRVLSACQNGNPGEIEQLPFRR